MVVISSFIAALVVSAIILVLVASAIMVLVDSAIILALLDSAIIFLDDDSSIIIFELDASPIMAVSMAMAAVVVAYPPYAAPYAATDLLVTKVESFFKDKGRKGITHVTDSVMGVPSGADTAGSLIDESPGRGAKHGMSSTFTPTIGRTGKLTSQCTAREQESNAEKRSNDLNHYDKRSR